MYTYVYCGMFIIKDIIPNFQTVFLNNDDFSTVLAVIKNRKNEIKISFTYPDSSTGKFSEQISLVRQGKSARRALKINKIHTSFC